MSRLSTIAEGARGALFIFVVLLRFDASAFGCVSSSVQQTSFWVQVVEDFLNSIRSWSADFVEEGGDDEGERAGVFFLRKSPAMLKMDYRNPPLRVIVLRDGKVFYYDKILREKTVTSFHSSLFSFLLDFKINLRKNVRVLECRVAGDELTMTFCKKDDKSGEKGVVRFVFSVFAENNDGKPTLRSGRSGIRILLKFWEVYRNIESLQFERPVRVSLKNQVTNQPIQSEEFFF